MNKENSLSNCTYGFSDEGRNVYSNLSLPDLEKWLNKLEDIDKINKFLELDNNLIIVDLNKKYLEHILDSVFPTFVSEAEHREVKTTPYPHHTQPHFLDVYRLEDSSSLIELHCRIKSKDSLTEKLTRDYAENGTMGLPYDSDVPLHISVRDVLGFSAVSKDKKSREKLEERVCSNSLLTSIERKIHYGRHNAIRHTFVWNGNTIPSGMIIEARFETEKEHYENKKGGNGCLSHDEYGKGKLKKPHEQGNNQIIILQKNGHNLEELSPVSLKNKYVNYTLINY